MLPAALMILRCDWHHGLGRGAVAPCWWDEHGTDFDVVIQKLVSDLGPEQRSDCGRNCVADLPVLPAMVPRDLVVIGERLESTKLPG